MHTKSPFFDTSEWMNQTSLSHRSPLASLRRSACTLLCTLLIGACALAAHIPNVWSQQGGDNDAVLDGANANPDETYNLPPNFSPDYRPKPTPRNIKVTLDFRQAQLEEVVKFFSSIMEKNFIIDNALQANKTITIISPTPVSLNEAYRAFLTALDMNGLTVVPYGSFTKIVPKKSAQQTGTDAIGPNERIPNEARMVTAILPVENADVDSIQKIVQQFASPEASIIVYGSSLIVTDIGRNLRRIQRLINKLDSAEKGNQVYVYKVVHAEAQEIQQKLTEIFEVNQAGNAPASGAARRNARRNTNAQTPGTTNAGGDDSGELDVEISEIIADERTNQLIILTNERSFERIQQMIQLLDVPTEAGGQIHVRFLEYSNAEELASTLSALASGASSSTTNRRATAARQPQAAGGGGGADVAQLLQGDVQITSHQPTNSLIIVASPRDYIALDKVVGLLDRPRRQVYVEAVIMELNFSDDLSLGLSYNGIAPQELDGLIPDSAIEEGYISDKNGAYFLQSSQQAPERSLLSLLGPALTIPGVDLASFGVSASAFAVYLEATQRENNINILSTPSIMTLDNEEAEIVVGDRVPFPRFVAGGGLGNLIGAAGSGAGALGGLGGAAGLLGGGLLGNQVQYEDVGITLRITPQVNESDYVRLEVDQEVSSIGAPSELGPTRSKRSIKTIVLVKDQSTVVIGGLIRDDENESETKVPFLGDIPVLGILFRSTKTVKTKQNLILMLTPYIIEGESDLRKIYDRKKEEREELLKLFQKRDIDYMRSVNYDKKGGLLDRMQDVIREADMEERARREALEAFEDNGPRYRILGTSAPVTQEDEEVEVSPTIQIDLDDPAPQTPAPPEEPAP